jgi:hypothetical protein
MQEMLFQRLKFKTFLTRASGTWLTPSAIAYYPGAKARKMAWALWQFRPTTEESLKNALQQAFAALQLRKPVSQISNFNLRTGILITGCMACGGGRHQRVRSYPGSLVINSGFRVLGELWRAGNLGEVAVRREPCCNLPKNSRAPNSSPTSEATINY